MNYESEQLTEEQMVTLYTYGFRRDKAGVWRKDAKSGYVWEAPFFAWYKLPEGGVGYYVVEGYLSNAKTSPTCRTVESTLAAWELTR